MSDDLLVGGPAIEAMLKDLNIDDQLKKLLEDVKAVKSVSKRDAMVKKIKYLAGLQKMKIKPAEAFIINHIPVVPPVVRPATVMGANRIEFADINQLYRDHMTVNMPQKENLEMLPPESLIKERGDLYNGAKAIFGLGDAISGASRGRGLKGLMTQISGVKGPKGGLFHNKLLSRKQDFTGRATIYAEPNLGFNEAAVPKDMLWSLYKFHILRDLSKSGYNYVDSVNAWTNRTPAATNSFNKVIKDVPVILNRAPTLMKSNITAHYPVPVEGNTLGINPLHLPLYAGDFDGDALTLHVPMNPEAVAEARNKMLPQHQIHDYRRGQGSSLIQPGHEAIVGSMGYTEPDKNQATKHFKTEKDALAALKAGHINETTPITIEEHE